MLRPDFSGLRARLILLVLLAAAPVVGIGLYTMPELYRHTKQDVEEEAMRLAEHTATSLQHAIAQTNLLLTILGELPQIREGETAQCSALLKSLRQEDGQYATLGVADPDGNVVCNALPFPAGMNIGDSLPFRRALETRGFAVNAIQTGRLTKQPQIVISRAVRGPGDQVRAVVYAAIPLAWLNRQIAAAELPAGSIANIVGPSRVVLARHPDPEKWVGKSIRNTPLDKAIEAMGEEGTAEIQDLAGAPRLFAFKRLLVLSDQEGFTLSVGLPAEAAFAETRALMLRNLTLLLGALLLLLAFAWWASKAFFLRPIETLLDATRRLSAGELSARAKKIPHGSSEIAGLAAAFNEMAANIEQRKAEAEQQLARITRLNRTHAMLSGSNGALLRIRDKKELLDEACRIAVEVGGFRLAWIAIANSDGEVRPFASAGEVPAYFENLGISTNPELPEGRGPICIALRENQRVVVNNIEADPIFAPWLERARALGLRSAAAFPLQVEGKVVAAFALYATEPGFFDEEELLLLDELAADASFGLEHIEQEWRLEYLAYYDALTGLPNRTLFEDRLDQAIARSQATGRHSIALVLDIDHFGRINDTLGHRAGDAVLREIGSRIECALREGDTVARLGNDEFGIALAGVGSPEHVAGVVDNILAAFPPTIKVGEHEIYVTTSMGIAIAPQDGKDAEELIKHAELALSKRKEAPGHSFAFYSAESDRRAHDRMKVEQQLRQAAERDEFTLHYQPVVDLKTREVASTEALLRWRNAELGEVSPVRFIPIAEETGLILPIGEWALATACRQGLRWREQGFPPVRIAVNVSVKQLNHPDFVERAKKIMAETEFDPAFLLIGIEITESELMENMQRAIDVLKQLRGMGITISIDDFGTGHSSLSYLKQLPIDTLKIDISFIKSIPDDPAAVSVVKGIIALAHGLDLKVVAEGVETEAQLALLAELGCDAVQGYFFSRPGLPEEIEKLFGRRLRSFSTPARCGTIAAFAPDGSSP